MSNLVDQGLFTPEMRAYCEENCPGGAKRHLSREHGEVYCDRDFSCFEDMEEDDDDL